MKGTPITKETIRKWGKMYLSGISIAKIAEDTNSSVYTVRNYIGKLKLSGRVEKTKVTKADLDELREELLKEIDN